MWFLRAAADAVSALFNQLLGGVAHQFSKFSSLYMAKQLDQAPPVFTIDEAPTAAEDQDDDQFVDATQLLGSQPGGMDTRRFRRHAKQLR